MHLNLTARIRRYASQHALWTPATRVVAAVSGGSDSVALFFLLRELAAAGDIQLAGLAHLHHHIRGAAADGDARFCEQLAARTGVRALVGHADVPALAREAGQSIEVAGRDARQRFYQEARVALDAACVALAHTRDDQAETVLLRLVRGAGPAGLSGIAPRRGPLVRPVLALTREELRGYLASIGEAWCEDATNADRENPRNRMRHDVLPALRAAFNPQVDAALARTADILRADTDLLDGLARDAAGTLVTLAGEGVRVDAPGLAALPPALARRVALGALETVNPFRAYGLEEADSLCRLAASSGSFSVPGVRMERSGAQVVLSKRGAGDSKGNPEGLPSPEFVLQVPGEVSGPGWVMTAEGPLPRSESPAPSAQSRVVVDADRVGATMRVRTRRPGDRLKPLGAPGRKKVQDLFVDRKVPRDERDAVPIVTDARGEIVWVAGHALAEPFGLNPLTTTVVVLSLRRV